MKFNNANKNLISEMDSTSTMRRNDTLLGGERAETTKILLLKKHGATPDIISRWKSAEARGISFESFLLGVIDELKGKNTDKIEIDDEDDSGYGGFVPNRNSKFE